jgi:hypothetical protein
MLGTSEDTEYFDPQMYQCDLCVSNTSATTFCQECSYFLCSDHRKGHQITKFTNSHVLITLKEYESQEFSKDIAHLRKHLIKLTTNLAENNINKGYLENEFRTKLDALEKEYRDQFVRFEDDRLCLERSILCSFDLVDKYESNLIDRNQFMEILDCFGIDLDHEDQCGSSLNFDGTCSGSGDLAGTQSLKTLLKENFGLLKNQFAKSDSITTDLLKELYPDSVAVTNEKSCPDIVTSDQPSQIPSVDELVLKEIAVPNYDLNDIFVEEKLPILPESKVYLDGRSQVINISKQTSDDMQLEISALCDTFPISTSNSTRYNNNFDGSVHKNSIFVAERTPVTTDLISSASKDFKDDPDKEWKGIDNGINSIANIPNESDLKISLLKKVEFEQPHSLPSDESSILFLI